MAEIENLEIVISASAAAAETRLNSFISTLQTMKSALTGVTRSTVKLSGTLESIGKKSNSASSNIRDVAKSIQESGRAARLGTSGLSGFLGTLRRIAVIRAARSLIAGFTNSIKEGISNLYQWSSAINGHFASSMDRLATSTLYLKNSLGAMVAPLIESFLPVLDTIIDKVVDMLNYFNMFVAAVSGASTYTVAKKAATAWGDSAHQTAQSTSSAVKELKRALLGFDEINKLTKASSSSGSSGGSIDSTSPKITDMFEEKPLEGIFQKISEVTKGWPDWLKALLGIGGVGIAAWGISKIPALIGNILGGLKDLIGLHLPNWLKWLFGGGSDGGNDVDLTNKIKVPDADVNVNLKKGDWAVMDELKNASILVPVGLRRWGWDNLPDWIGRAVTVSVALKRWGWGILSDWIGSAVTVAVGLKRWGWKTLSEWTGASNGVLVKVGLLHWGWNNIQDWIGRAVTVKVALSKWGWSTLDKWIGADKGLFVKIGLQHWGWSNIGDYIGKAVTVAVALKKWAWTSFPAWAALDKTYPAMISLTKRGWTGMLTWLGLDKTYTANIQLSKRGWASIEAWAELNKTYSLMISPVKRGWDTLGRWTGADNGLNVAISLIRRGWYDLRSWIGDSLNVYVNLIRGNFWSLTSWLGDYVYVDVYLSRGNFWSLDWWLGDWVDVAVYLTRGNFWSLENWIGNSVTVRVNLKMGNGGVITVNGSNGFGGATGGGGTTSGGGAGRGRRALGGIFSNGIWKDIPQYAGGTTNAHGSLFLAGEAGPEIVGHVGGRTEVLNKSQLASAMYQAVNSAMQGVTLDANFYNAGGGEADYETMYKAMYDAVTDAMAKNDDYDRQKVELLRQINSKDFTAEITTGQINKAQAYANRRAGTTIVAVGT